MLSLLLELFRKNSELTKPISHEKFEKLIRLFIREKIFFTFKETGKSIYFDDPEFITKYYKMISPTKAINTKDENKFIEIIQLSRIPPPPPLPPRRMSVKELTKAVQILRPPKTDGKKTHKKSRKKSQKKKKSLRKK